MRIRVPEQRGGQALTKPPSGRRFCRACSQAPSASGLGERAASALRSAGSVPRGLEPLGSCFPDPVEVGLRYLWGVSPCCSFS